MSEEQLDPKTEETAPAVTASAAPEETRAPAQPETRTATPSRAARLDDDDDDDDDAAEVDDQEIPPADDTADEEEEDEEEAEGFDDSGPTEFQPKRQEQRRGGGGGFRGRNRHRIGSDVRIEDIDYKKVEVLMRFIDNRGRILSRRKTRVSAKMQRRVTQAIKRARHLALIPFTAEHVRLYRRR